VLNDGVKSEHVQCSVSVLWNLGFFRSSISK